MSRRWPARLVPSALAAWMMAGCASAVGLPGDESALTGISKNVQPLPFHPTWRRELTPDDVYRTKPHELASPAYDFEKNRLAIGSNSGWFNCLRASDGAILWRVRVAGGFMSQATFDQGRIIVGTDDGIMIALDERTGDELWRYRVQGAIIRAPVVGGENLFFTDGTNSVYTLNRATGGWAWQYRRDPPSDFALVGESGALIASGKLFVGFSDGHVVALDAKDGAVLWTRDLAPEHDRFQDVDATPVLHNGRLYAASAASGLYALDPENGKVIWTVPVLGITGMLKIGDDLLLSSDRGAVLRVSLRNGSTQWRTRFVDGAPSRPSLVGDLVVVGLTKGSLYFLDAKTGRPVSRFSPGQGISAGVTAGPEPAAFVLSNGGVLYAFQQPPHVVEH